MAELESYNELKIQYDAMQKKLKKLDNSWIKSYAIYVASNRKNKKESKKLKGIVEEILKTRKLSKSISHQLLVIEYQRTGITLSEVSRKYNVEPNTIKKLFKANNVEYIPAQMLRWRPIGSAPKDGTFILVWFEEAQHHCILWWFADNWRFKGGDIIPIVDPTYWMPLPEPPK